MSWQILLTISITSAIGLTLLQRVLMKKEDSDPISFSIVSNLTAGLLIGIFALIKGVSIANILNVVPNLLLMAILYGLANIFIFHSLKIVEASNFTILFSTRALWSIFAAIIFLNEAFLPRQFLGTILIILGIILILLKANKLKLGKGELFVLLAAATFGSQFVNDAAILESVDVFLYTPMIFIVPSLLLWIIFPKSTKRVVALFTSPKLTKVILLGVFFAISATTYLMAYQAGRNAAQLASINQTQTVLTVIAATIILKERQDTMKKIIASILTFIGVLLVR